MLSPDEKNRRLADLYAPLNNLLFFPQAFSIFADFSCIESIGKTILIQNMNYYKNTWKISEFQIDAPYADYDIKNMYFAVANQICQDSLWRSGLYSFAASYYQSMLDTIKQFEKEQNYHFNKGMVYANLGIAQAIQKLIDEGFANLLKALDEDRGYYALGRQPTQEFFESPLFKQLEQILVLSFLNNQITFLIKDGETCPTAEDFLKSLLDPHQRIFFEYTYSKIVENQSVFEEKNNSFSANRLIVYLQDMCVFAEDYLKKKGHNGMLNELITGAFPGVSLSGCGASTTQELNNKIMTFMSEQNKKKRSLCILLTLRNFSSHNIPCGESQDYIPKNFESVFVEVLRAIFHIYKLP
jgi:hypothetical protein